MTAGNSTPLTDGASAVLLASEQWALERNLPIQAYLTHSREAAVDFVNDEGLLMAPAYAVSDMLKAASLELDDFDIYEIHEAFAAQTLATMKAWESEEFCKDRLLRHRSDGQHRPRQAQSQRRKRRARPSIRSNRHAHTCDTREAIAGTRQRSRPDFGLHGRRHGRDCNRRDGSAAVIDTSLFVSFVIVASAIIVMPGPNVLVTIATSMTQGHVRGMQVVAGTLAAMAIQLYIAAAGTALLAEFLAEAFRVVKWVGAVYLLYLGIGRPTRSVNE